MLETFELKKQLSAVKQELSHALYQHDAACRVIARLTKERDEARAAASSARSAPQQKDAMEVDGSLPSHIVSIVDEKAKVLQRERKKRPTPPGLASRDEIAGYENVATQSGLHSASQPGLTCLDIHHDQTKILTGGVDKTAAIFDLESGTRVAQFKHTKRVNAVKFHQDRNVAVTAGDDGVRVHSSLGADIQSQQLSVHKADVSGIDIHPTGALLISASRDGSWALHDFASLQCLTQVRAESSLECVQFHPDGLIIGAGSVDQTVRIYDLKTQKAIATFTEGYTSKGTAPLLTLQFLISPSRRMVSTWPLARSLLCSCGISGSPRTL